MNKTIGIIGTGNVAWHLAKAFSNKNIELAFIVGRSIQKTNEFATEFGCTSLSFADKLPQTDFLFIAISDPFIKTIAQQIRVHPKTIVAHTADSISIDELHPCLKRAVVYPFQSLTKNIQANYNNVPFVLEGCNKNVLSELSLLMGSISNNIEFLNSEQRQQLHMSGIIANNFTNFLNLQAFKLLEKNDIPTKLLLPILKETVRKLEETTPEEAQTGPARRNNSIIIDKHLSLLQNNPELKELYRLMSKQITNYFHNK